MSVTTKKEFGTTQHRRDLTGIVYGKIPPQSLELEKAVIGVLLLERDAFDLVVTIIPHEGVFYSDTHQIIYRAILSLNRKGVAVDLLTVIEELRRTNELELCGGFFAVTMLTDSVSSSAHVEAHARIVYEKFMQRELIRVGGSTISEAYEDSTDVFDLLVKAQGEIQVIAEIPGATQTVQIGASANAVIRQIHENRASDAQITGIPTGYPTMNEKMYGWQKTDLTILAARPSVGKTAFAINLAFNAINSNSENKKYASIIFSLEMGHARITKRVLAFDGQVDLGEINRPKNLQSDELTTLNLSAKKLSSLPIWIHDNGCISTMGIRSEARRMMRKHPNHEFLIIIDYLQLITPFDAKTIREQQISKISRDLKHMAKELDVPIIALSQLNRGKNNDEEPDLRDLRESGAIEQDADNVMFLYRPPAAMMASDVYLQDKVILKGAKFRDGETFSLPLQFQKQYQKFVEPQPEPMNYPQRPDKPNAGFPAYKPNLTHEPVKPDLPL